MYWWSNWLPPQFLLIFDHDTICNNHLLELFGSYSKCVLMIKYPHTSDTKGILFSSISGNSQDWRGCCIWTVSRILCLHHYAIIWTIWISDWPWIPCCLNSTIFSILFSSSPLCISPCNNWCFSLPAALSILMVGKNPRPALTSSYYHKDCCFLKVIPLQFLIP